jgi:DNA polymerase III subunit epsilon
MPSKVIFLDTETTGLDFINDELIQIAAITCDLDTQEIDSSINYYIESTIEVPERVTQINGYYRGKWEAEGFNPVPMNAVVPLVLDYLKQKDSVIFCHNASFDRAFVSIMMNRHGVNPLDQPKYFCDSATLACLFRMKSDWERVSLDYCADRLKVAYKRLKKHDGLDDCYLLKEVFFALMKSIHVDRV